MDILIESTAAFEQDLRRLSQDRKDEIISEINDFASLVSDSDFNDLQELLYCIPHVLDLGEYDSSLYVLRVSGELEIVLAIDEDPIFNQTILNLFRLTDPIKITEVYQEIAAHLYQDLIR
ncbi:MAG: hypothetical protein ACHWZW_22510 [Spirulina sp.]